MTDIVERLRETYNQRSGAGHWDMLHEAADEIERLQDELKAYQKLIKPLRVALGLDLPAPQQPLAWP